MAGPCTAAITSSESGVEGVVLNVLRARLIIRELCGKFSAFVRVRPHDVL